MAAEGGRDMGSKKQTCAMCRHKTCHFEGMPERSVVETLVERIEIPAQ